MDNNYKKEIESLKIRCEGIQLEYNYVNGIKDKRIKNLESLVEKETEEKNYYKDEFDKIVEKLEKCQQELEKIKNSKWWKLRSKIKGEK